MSFCPNAILRSRLNVGLSPSAWTSPRLWHRQRGTTLTLRRLLSGAPGSSGNSLDKLRVVDNDLPSPEASQQSVAQSILHLRSTAARPSPAYSSHYRDITIPDTLGLETPYKFPLEYQNGQETLSMEAEDDTSVPANATMKADHVKTISVPSTRKWKDDRLRLQALIEQLNRQAQELGKPMTARSIHLDASIRLKSLYRRPLGFRQWKSACLELFSAKSDDREISNPALIPALNESDWDLFRKIQEDGLDSFKEAWEEMNRPAKASHWQRLALHLLQQSPDLMLKFLLVTCQSSDIPNFNMVVDSFIYLEQFHRDALTEWKEGEYTYDSVIELCLDPRDWPILRVTQKGIWLFLQRASHKGLVLALRTVNERQTSLTGETVLVFMRRFMEMKDVDKALETLQLLSTIDQEEFALDSQVVMRTCCKLLTLDTVQTQDGVRNFHILPRLLELGIRPDRDMMNVVLSNAFKTGDPELGFDVLDFMKSHNHEFDSYTYMTLLCDAVARGERHRVDLLLQEIQSQDQLRENPFLSSKLFHAHYVFTAKHMDTDADASEIFSSMLNMYNELHDITPLKELLIVPPNYTPPIRGMNSPPSRIAMYIMLATYFRCQKGTSNINRVYSRFRALLTEGNEMIAPLAETDHIYNEFIVAFRDSPRNLRRCVRIVEDMLSHIAQDGVIEGENGNRFIHAKPSVRTWSILLSAFIFNKQLFAAEKVKEMMAKYNIQFNEVTWNHVISGYANAQMIPEVAQAIKSMEEDGYSADAYTVRSLRYLRDPERLWVAVDELDANSEALDARLAPFAKPSEFAGEPEKEHEHLLDRGLQNLKMQLQS
ncbi:hypothetical protein ASPZODRAFT_128064 [Penicilliopsis zonata CBS 506.65]|uniref:Pentacotripeptide-repeat region of PRORP domain-containing protein n=1 Tax=Penicilliopsis zonata CBS 506.65 TaxID=1073090 RepID=A0A1L9SQS1_9EURO|nr:hypothetical protein ASPZODRAFT_128064 [Penicilliopsis zonata CBS 506.65]OJJ49575.1 hypothetical protein ASPZODRAFT_128064 [Penicilliopsis zonata CBS 506.65]